ncbi:MAG: hypothetical protein ACKVQS_13220 [Fimbriimonadaceae bacterium]
MSRMFSKATKKEAKSATNTRWFRCFVISGLIVWTPTLNFEAIASSDIPELPEAYLQQFQTSSDLQTESKPGVKDFLQSLDYNREESREIVTRNAEAIQSASAAYSVPDWMIAGIIYVETAQGIPGAWRWNDSASRDLFVGFGRPTSMGVMQVRQNPDELGLKDHWQRMMFARTYTEDEEIQINDGAKHLQAVLQQSNRLGSTSANDFQWSTHKLAVIAHEYNTGPTNWRNTTWDEAIPSTYGELFTKFLPDAYQALHGTDLTNWPLPEVPEELLNPEFKDEAN